MSLVYVRCILCSKILQCSKEDTTNILEHIKNFHPEISVLISENNLEANMTAGKRASGHQEVEKKECNSEPVKHANDHHVDFEMVQKSEVEPTPTSLPLPTQPPCPSAKVLYTRKYKLSNPFSARAPARRRLYKTSIEKWRPGIGIIYCPKCGCTKRPLIKSQSEKVSTSTLGAACILTCWPLCFLPCLFPPPAREYLYCAVCNNYLGLYDKQNECVRPNRQYVEPEVMSPNGNNGNCRENNNNSENGIMH